MFNYHKIDVYTKFILSVHWILGSTVKVVTKIPLYIRLKVYSQKV